jgi:hypothetical protein
VKGNPPLLIEVKSSGQAAMYLAFGVRTVNAKQQTQPVLRLPRAVPVSTAHGRRHLKDYYTQRSQNINHPARF